MSAARKIRFAFTECHECLNRLSSPELCINCVQASNHDPERRDMSLDGIEVNFEEEEQ